ncbi:RNA polymerase subunit sigma [Brenneria roseae subsp. roseae]|uniref:sigma-70 family RNA polymerase sigma factor n=1 Tax=Brenneria roseae TaxID=1509241 RepID=UPI000D60534C|nr:sigma-70 family RNA polymerase sigma factor [Brenneria roseae]PWC18028.1 RNA polymerase subunit sigma [Brenneria roseae subsp. roseae]
MNNPAFADVNQTESLLVQQIYHEHHSWLQAWLRRRLGCSQQAADLAQDTFLRLISQHQATQIREPRAWLTTVAHGLVVNYWRRKDIENAYLQVLSEQAPAVVPSLEQQAMTIDALLEIDRMLATLPAKVRQAFLWVHLDGLTYRQVAGRLAVSERMVKKYMAQAMLNCLLCRDL